MSQPPSQLQIAKLTKLLTERAATSSRDFTVSQIISAIKDMERGRFAGVYNLSKLMMRDEHITAFLEHRLLTALHLPIKISEENDLVEEWVNVNLTQKLLKKIYKDYLLFGISLNFIEWQKPDGIWEPKIKPLSLEHLEYDLYKNEWSYQFREEKVVIDPESPNYLFISDWVPGETSGLVPKLAEAWANKRLAIEDWIEANPLYANPMMVITDDPNRGGTDVNRDDLAFELQNNKRNRVLQLEAGQTFKIEHTFSNFSPSTFLSFVEEARKSYAIAILGGNLTSDVSGGSHAAATVHQSILEEMVSADTQRLAKELNKITNLLLFFNKQQSDAHLKWDFNENEDTLQTLSILKQIQEITNQTVDIEPFLERWNIKINK